MNKINDDYDLPEKEFARIKTKRSIMKQYLSIKNLLKNFVIA